jgi:hypothetical protein
MMYDKELDEWICAKGDGWCLCMNKRKRPTVRRCQMGVPLYGMCRMPVSSGMHQRQRHENHPRFFEKSTTTLGNSGNGCPTEAGAAMYRKRAGVWANQAKPAFFVKIAPKNYSGMGEFVLTTI